MPEKTIVELDAQYRQLREECGLLDRSERGKFVVRGPDAAEYLQGQLTNDIEGLAPGEGCYAALLDRKGHMQSDMRVLRTGPEEIWIDTEATAGEAVLRHLTMYSIGREVEIANVTDERAILSLIGPRSAEIAATPPLPEYANLATRWLIPRRGVTGGAPGQADQGRRAQPLPVGKGKPEDTEPRSVPGASSRRAWSWNQPSSVAGIDCLAAGTAEGVDLIAGAAEADRLRAALLEAGAAEVGPEAVEVLRIEAGRPRFGAEMSAETMPAEGGIVERAVDFEKGCYIGQEPVARLHYKGRPNRRLRGLELSAPAAPGTPLLLGEKEVGRIGSACVSPARGPIALAIVRREAEPGAELAAGEDGVTGRVVDLPFG